MGFTGRAYRADTAAPDPAATSAAACDDGGSAARSWAGLCLPGMLAIVPAGRVARPRAG